jgi:pimeloyl-ACP methyl ester carboxylesterase
MLRARTYGLVGPPVVVVHGGPGAPGSAAGIARGLAEGFRVVEPFQRPSGAERLTVARHVEDLRQGIAAWFPGERPALVGHSWGAMLAIAFAAEHPDAVAAVAMVGSGTFDAATRALFVAAREARTTPALREALSALEKAPLPAGERLARRAEMLDAIYFVDVEPEEGPSEPVDARSNEETWADMLRLQADGTYPASLARARCPVLMLHGDSDPHPGRAIRDSLAPFLPRLAYVEFARCGHEPWRERAARGPFLAALRTWLADALAGQRGGP